MGCYCTRLYLKSNQLFYKAQFKRNKANAIHVGVFNYTTEYLVLSTKQGNVVLRSFLFQVEHSFYASDFKYCPRLRVVSHFSSGIVGTLRSETRRLLERGG